MLAQVASHVARAHGVPVERVRAGLLTASVPFADRRLVPPEHLARPELLGRVYESLLGQGTRRRAGAFYTPERVAANVVEATLGPLEGDPHTLRVCDPAVGGGVFLIAAARHLAARGGELPRIVAHCLFGVDVDPLAVEVTEAALVILGWDDEGSLDLHGHLRHGDALLDRPDSAPLAPGRFDAVVGNPPFLTQLRSGTVRARAVAADLEARFGEAARGYADTSNLFLLLGLDMVRAGGRVGLVLPDSFLVARDAGPTRRAAAARSTLEWLWLARDAVFDAGVRVCSPVFRAGPGLEITVERTIGSRFDRLPPVRLPAAGLRSTPGWAFLFADATGVPAVELTTGTTLRHYCRATAGFRDQFYGLAPFVFDGDEVVADEGRFPRLVTSGLIDPGRCLWGHRSTRFAGRRFERPRVDLARLEQDGRLAAWVGARLVPKVLLSTQTRVLEAVVDAAGEWVPSVPTISIEARPERLWHVAAALTAPPLTAWALRHHAGAALAPDAIKLSAKQLLALPAPAQGGDWDVGAEALRAAARAGNEAEWRQHLEQVGRAMCRALCGHVDPALLAWWLERLPPWRGDQASSSSPVPSWRARSSSRTCSAG